MGSNLAQKNDFFHIKSLTFFKTQRIILLTESPDIF